MDNRSIKESMVAIKKEKLSIILKELLHLKYILNYYSPKAIQDPQYREKTNKIDMSTANKSLKSIEKSLERVKKYIDILQEHTAKEEDIYFLILHSKIEYDFNTILYIIELIYKKVYQIFEESYHQYIPKPTLGRRFSNNNLVGYLKEHYESIINALLKKEYKGLILSWSYRNYISLEEKHEQFIAQSTNKEGAYINLPYWYYEIPILLPSVGHECVRIALLQEDFLIKGVKNFFQKAVSNYLNKPRNDLSFAQEEIILMDKYNLTDKIVADLISYKIYGIAYLYSLFHDIIAVGLAKTFALNIKKEQEEFSSKQESIKEFIERYFEWKASSYKFDPLRDISLIRLYVLINYALMHPSSYDNSPVHIEHINQMHSLLNAIVGFSDKKSDLESIYANHPHYYNSFLILNEAITNIAKLYINTAYEKGLLFLEKRDLIKQINFKTLWEKHFKNNIHKNELRKILYNDMLKIITKECENEKEKNEIGTPYVLTFVKMLKKLQCNFLQKSHTQSCLDNVINHCFKDESYYHAFGLYDLAILKDTSQYPIKLNSIIKKKFQEIDALNEGTKERYYKSHFSLMQIYPTINGKNESKSNNITLLYNIDLTSTYGNILEFMAKSTLKLAKILKEHTAIFKKVKIFKTLGPGDLIVLIDGVSNEDFLGLTEKIQPLPFIKRTFTTVLAQKDMKYNIKPNKNYQIVSYIRLDLSAKESVYDIIKSTLKEFDARYIDKIYHTSGVLDLEVVWKRETSLKTVMSFYNILMKKSLVRDFQTKFNKLYPLNNGKI